MWQLAHIAAAGRARRIIFDEAPAKTAGLGCDNIELYFEADDIDAALMLVGDAGTDIIDPIREEPSGQRAARKEPCFCRLARGSSQSIGLYFDCLTSDTTKVYCRH